MALPAVKGVSGTTEASDGEPAGRVSSPISDRGEGVRSDIEN